MMSVAAGASARPLASEAIRWGQLVFRIVCMVMIANLQYGWTSVGNALKWFPDRRGLAAGLTAAGFGAGSALTVVPIANIILSSGYEAAFWWFGIGQGLVVIVVALLLRAPEPGEVAAPATGAVL